MDGEDVVAVIKERAIALTCQDRFVMIRAWIDPFGEYCEAGSAVCAVGVDTSGQWWSVDLERLPDQRIH